MPNKLIVGAILLTCCLLFAGEALLLTWPSDLGYPESAVIYKAISAASGEALYRDWRSEPYAVTPYTPVYYLAVGLGANWLGLTVSGTYVFARLITLCATLGILCLIYLISRKSGSSISASLIAAGIFLSSPLLIPWGFVSRPDMLAIFLSLLGILVYLNAGQRDLLHLVAALLFVSAALTKQTAMAAPLSVALHLLWERRFLQAVRFMVIWSGLLAATFMIIDRGTDGLFFLNVISANAVPFRLDLIYRVAVEAWSLNALVVLLAVPSVFSKQARSRSSIRLILIYLFISFIAAAASTAKIGSNTNYYSEAVAVMSVLASLALHDLFSKGAISYGRYSAKMWASAIILTVGVVAALVGRAYSKYWYLEARDINDIVYIVSRSSGDLLTDYPNIAIRSGKKVVIADPYFFSLLARQGKWSPQGLTSKIRRQEFSLIVLTAPLDHPHSWQGIPHWPAEILDAINNRYDLAGMANGGFFVYVPASQKIGSKL